MQTLATHPTPADTDALLCWTMRAAGLLLLLVSTFFLMKDFSLGHGDDVFFSMSLLLGTVNLLGSRRAAR